MLNERGEVLVAVCLIHGQHLAAAVPTGVATVCGPKCGVRTHWWTAENADALGCRCANG